MNALSVVDSPVYIQLPLTQPLRNSKIITDVIEKIDSGDYDFVTSFQDYVDRSIFFLNDDLSTFRKESENRKGSMCNKYPMIDGAIYAIQKEFIKKINESNDPNATFWAGKFCAIPNDVLFFIDIDDKTDMIKFRALPQLLN